MDVGAQPRCGTDGRLKPICATLRQLDRAIIDCGLEDIQTSNYFLILLSQSLTSISVDSLFARALVAGRHAGQQEGQLGRRRGLCK